MNNRKISISRLALLLCLGTALMVFAGSAVAAGQTNDLSYTFPVGAYAISSNESYLFFDSETEGYSSAPDAQTVTITNTGSAALTLTLPTDASYLVTTNDSLSLAPGASAAVSIRPKLGLAVGAYHATLAFTTDHSVSCNVGAMFTVIAAEYAISANPSSLNFGSMVEGDSPAVKTVTITNTGIYTLQLTLPKDDAYLVTTASSLTLAPEDTATVSIQPKTGLTTGTYNRTLTFTTDQSASAQVIVSLSVQPPVRGLTVSPQILDFGMVAMKGVDGSNPYLDRHVVIANDGTMRTTIRPITSTYFGIRQPNITELRPGDFTVLYVYLPIPISLTPGEYIEDIVIASDNPNERVASYVTAKVVVKEHEFTILQDGKVIVTWASPQSCSVTVDAPVEKFIHLYMDGRLASQNDYSITSGSTIITLFPSYLNTLSVGDHELLIEFTDGLARTVLTVLPAPEMPVTGDGEHTALYGILAVLALAALLLLRRRRAYR